MYKTTFMALVVLRQFVKAKRKVVVSVDVVDSIVTQAMGYAWEVGHGKALTDVLDASPENPFLNVEWRKDVV